METSPPASTQQGYNKSLDHHSPYQFDKNNRIQDPNDGAYWQHQRAVSWAPEFSSLPTQVGRSQQFTVEPLTNEDVARIEQESRIAFESRSPSRFADQSDIEGLKSELFTTTTKRSRRLRNKAFDVAKGVCAVCRKDFTTLLDGRGIRVLQVHHREQLSSRDGPAVTKLADLVVVCANCHLLLHLDTRKTLSVAKLRNLLQNAGYLDGA